MLFKIQTFLMISVIQSKPDRSKDMWPFVEILKLTWLNCQILFEKNIHEIYLHGLL